MALRNLVRIAASLALTAAASIAVQSAAQNPTVERAGVYGYVRKAVLEPNSENATRIQLWGTFCVGAAGSVAGSDNGYESPARGYLYFERPASGDVAAEWTELKRLADTGGPWPSASGRSGSYYGITGFAAAGSAPRLRTSDEAPQNPDPYRPGNGVRQIAYGAPNPAVEMLGRLPIALTRSNYALVDRVLLEPDAGHPERIQIWGAFAIGLADGYSFSAPERGYLYLKDRAGNPPRASTLAQWERWAAAAGQRVPVHFNSDANKPEALRVRKPAEAPASADEYTLGLSDFTIRTDTRYAPIVALLTLR